MSTDSLAPTKYSALQPTVFQWINRSLETRPDHVPLHRSLWKSLETIQRPCGVLKYLLGNIDAVSTIHQAVCILKKDFLFVEYAPTIGAFRMEQSVDAVIMRGVEGCSKRGARRAACSSPLNFLLGYPQAKKSLRPNQKYVFIGFWLSCISDIIFSFNHRVRLRFSSIWRQGSDMI